MKKIFISQAVLDSLFSDGKASLVGDLLTIHSRRDQVYRLTPACKFIKVGDDAADVDDLVGKIFSRSELEKIKADVYMDSALVNDRPYTVEPGFLGLPEGEEPAPAIAPAPQAASPAAGPVQPPAAAEAKELSDEDMLSEYLAKIL